MIRSQEVVLSLAIIPEITEAQRSALIRLDLHRVSDLLLYRPIHNAQLLVDLAEGRVMHDFDLIQIIDANHFGKSAAELIQLGTDALSGVGTSAAAEWTLHFGVRTIEQLATVRIFQAAQQLVAAMANTFSEPASAPPELMPTIMGAIQNSHCFSSFVNTKTIRIPGAELLFDQDRVHYIDERLAVLFAVRGIGAIFSKTGKKPPKSSWDQYFGAVPTPVPELHLGYAVRHRQDWVNLGTFLGEIQHSLALAPGESRNIATIDWKRTQLTRREEDTDATELLTNELVHVRALDEVARSTAFEHQFGGTGIAAGTASGSVASVLSASLAGGVAGAVPAAAVGGIVGALVGTPAGGPPGTGIGAAIGAAGGAMIGFGVGAAIAGSAALLATANAQLGVIRSDSTGNRRIFADIAQDITETTSQKASSIRSLWSTVFVSDTQAENESLQTRNVTNYNHSHAMTVQYFEVLQRYRTEIRPTDVEPFLFLPFRPLEFTFDLIADYWSILRQAIQDSGTRHRFDAVLAQFDTETDAFSTSDGDQLVDILVSINRTVAPSPFVVPAPFEVRLLGPSPVIKRIGTTSVRFDFSDEPRDAVGVTGVQVRGLRPGEPVTVMARSRVEAPDAAERLVSSVSDRLTASESGRVRFDFRVGGVGPTAEELQASANEIQRYFNAHRYRFTRLLLLSIEREQLIDLVEALILRRAFVADFTPSPLSARPDIPAALPGFAQLKPTIGTALASVLTGSLRQTILGDLVSLDQAPTNEVLVHVDAAINQAASGFRRLSQLPAGQRKPKIAEVLAPVSSALQAAKVVAEPTITTGLRDLLDEAAKKFDLEPAFREHAVRLVEFIDPTPFAITGNTLVFRMRTPSAAVAGLNLVTTTELKDVAEFPDEIQRALETRKAANEAEIRDVYLPTSGVFAEALLGRANASEKLDVSRFFNWQDSPIPHLAPAIAQLEAGIRSKDPLDVSPTISPSVLNLINPSAFPDPTGMASVLAAIQNGNIFRDMSKAEQLTQVLGNLSQLAAKTTEIAGTLTGEAQANALKSAVEIASTAAKLAQTPTDQGLEKNSAKDAITDPVPPPASPPPPPPPPPPSTPVPPVKPRIRDVRITFRAFVPSEVWEVKPSLGTLSLAMLNASLVDAFFAATRSSGQDRGFGRTAGDSMAEAEITFKIDTESMEVIDFDKSRRKFGRADFYLSTDTTDVGGTALEWEEKLDAGATVIQSISGGVLAATDSNFAIGIERVGQSPVVRIELDAAPYLPFTPDSLSFMPDVPITIAGISFSGKEAITKIVGLNTNDLNTDIRIRFDKEADGELKVSLSGTHDPFPAYEIYVNDDTRGYTFTPSTDDAPEQLSAILGTAEAINFEPFVLKRLARVNP